MSDKWKEFETWETSAAKIKQTLLGLFMENADTLAEMMCEAIEDCGSPIERLLLWSMVQRFWPYFFGISFGGETSLNSFGCAEVVTIIPQAKIDRFRVDFLVEFPMGDKASKVIVECDGHDYHERTKEQAAKDKSRDRALKMLGYDVLRFTGSEIWADPIKCATEVEDCLRVRCGYGKMSESPGRWLRMDWKSNEPQA